MNNHNFADELVKALEIQKVICNHPPRKFYDGQIVVVQGERVSVVQFATPATLDGSTFTWIYCCPFMNAPGIAEYLTESALTDLLVLEPTC
jgi:hypothetical protein